MKAVLVVSHGSHSSKTKAEIISLVDIIKKADPNLMIDFAFLEIEKPSIPDGIKECVSNGADEIVILLNFLNSGKHVDEDIPLIVHSAQSQHPSVKFHLTKPIGRHPKIVEIFLDMIHAQ